jgi:hypothetical protein
MQGDLDSFVGANVHNDVFPWRYNSNVATVAATYWLTDRADDSSNQ